MKFFLLTFIILFLSTFVFAGVINAKTPPGFPACSNPQGTLKIEYKSGVHGIPGDLNAYTGSDKVYTLDNDRVLQCFCSEAGNGIQTNWWRVGSLVQGEIDTLVKLGWNYIPDGSGWGLSNEVYLAFNRPYSCGSSSLAAGGSVLGLASTGNIAIIYGLTILGFTSIFFGILFKRKYSP